MDAGYGAEEQATRRSHKLERLRRERDADASTRSAVEAELERVQKQQRAWSAGAEGERQVATTLATLAPYGWTALHDVHWPGRPQANIDHIAIGPGGVVIIDAKNWTGDVILEGGMLRQNGYRRDREVDGAAQAAAAVTVLFQPQHRSGVRAAICLAGQDQAPTSCGPGVLVVGRLQLPSLLMSLPLRFSPYDVADVGRYLAQELGGPKSPDLTSTAALTTPPRSPRSRGRGFARPRPASTPVTRRPARRSRNARPKPKPWGQLFRLIFVIVAVLMFINYLNGMVAAAP